MASHEWPPQPSSLKSSSSMRRKLFREALAAVDWHKPRRFESYSDGEDELPSPQSREPPERACQSSAAGHIEGKGAVNNGDSKIFQSSGYNNRDALQSSGYDDGIHRTNISSSNKEAKVKLPANRRVNHTSLASQPTSAPLWLNACPFSGPLKVNAGRTHPNRSSMQVKKTTCSLNPREPFSPEVTCLGRVRIKENQGHNTDLSFPEEDGERRRHKHMSDEITQSRKLRSKKEAAEKAGCLARRKQIKESVSVVSVSDTTETRRERAAALARTLTSLLEDLRKLEMEKERYEPAVPPPNSLLLMRGLGSVNKLHVQEIARFCDEGDSLPKEHNAESDVENIFDQDLCFPGMKMKMERIALTEQAFNNKIAHTNVLREHGSAHRVLPLSEIKGNSLAQNTSLSEPKGKVPVDHHSKDHPQQLALWQRRAIAKLDAIDTKMPMQDASKRPSTK